MYQDVRGPDGRLLFRFDPERDLVELVQRGVAYVVDLARYRPPEEATPETVTPSQVVLDMSYVGHVDY